MGLRTLRVFDNTGRETLGYWGIAPSTGAALGSAAAARAESQRNFGSQPCLMVGSQIGASDQLTGSTACVATCLGQGEGKMRA